MDFEKLVKAANAEAMAKWAKMRQEEEDERQRLKMHADLAVKTLQCEPGTYNEFTMILNMTPSEYEKRKTKLQDAIFARLKLMPNAPETVQDTCSGEIENEKGEKRTCLKIRYHPDDPALQRIKHRMIYGDQAWL